MGRIPDWGTTVSSGTWLCLQEGSDAAWQAEISFRGNGKERRGVYLTLGLCVFPARRPLSCPCVQAPPSPPEPTFFSQIPLPQPPLPPDFMPCHKSKLPPQPYLLLRWLIYYPARL